MKAKLPPVVLVLRKLRRKDPKCEVSLGGVARPQKTKQRMEYF